MSATAATQPPVPTPSAPVTYMMTVSDINQRFPQCTPVFNKYGLGGCGGEYGPPEPLVIFAAAHHVPVKQLVDELNSAVRGEWKDDSKSADDEIASAVEQEQGENLYKRFVGAALFFGLTSGTAWGAYNITRIALEQSWTAVTGAVKQAHGHEQLFGWVGLFIMGVAFHAVPRFKMLTIRPLWAAKLCFVLMVAGVLLRAIVQPFAANPAWGIALIASAALELGAIGLFAWLIARIVTHSQQESEFYEKFIWASVGWLVVLGVWNLILTARMFGFSANTISALPAAMFVHVAFFGFIANMIFGFSMRVLPHFLGLRETKVWAANTAFWLWNGAIFLRYPIEQLAWPASILEMLAAILFIYALGIWAKRRVKIDIKGVDPAFAWFIHHAYAWLLIVAFVPLHADIFRLTASTRHSMAIGFVASMIMGVAHRVLPIFNGVNLYSNRAMRATFCLLATGSTLAFAMALISAYETTWAFVWAAVAGWLVLAAVVLFAWNIAMTLRVKAEKFTRDSVVKLNTRVTEMLEVWPDLRPVLIHNGLSVLTRLGNRNPPRFVTIEFAARRHDIDPRPLIHLLNQEIQKRKNP